MGGLVGKADKDSDVQLTDCYFAGKLLGASENSDPKSVSGRLRSELPKTISVLL
ncbi:MAG: hypothetical protein ACLUD2_13265 [Clostridium sp.]